MQEKMKMQLFPNPGSTVPHITEGRKKRKCGKSFLLKVFFSLPFPLSLYRVMQVDFICSKSPFLLSVLGKAKSLILLHTLNCGVGKISLSLPGVNPISIPA